MPYYLSHTYYQCSINPKLDYPLVASLLSNNQLEYIQTIIHSSVITAK